MTRSRPARPPTVHQTLLRWTLPSGIRRESIIGDLLEEFAVRAETRSVHEARAWYRRQARRVVLQHLLRRGARAARPGVAARSVPRNRRRGDSLVITILRDLHFAIRGFGRAPGFTAVAVLTVALGVGANTAIFSVVHGVLLRPLPYPEPDRIVRPWAEKIFSRQMYLDFREQTESFSHVALFGGGGLRLTEGDEPVALDGRAATADYFQVLGVNPFMGRGVLPEDEQPGAEPVIILSYGLWQSHFGGDPDIIGRTISVEGQGAQSRTVIGILPPDFTPLGNAIRAWVPFNMDPETSNYRRYGYRILARLAPGVTLEQSRAEVTPLAETFAADHPTQFRPVRRSPIPVLTLHESIVGDVRVTLMLLLGAVSLVLLIACTNVANLLLARSGAREREMAIRLALGASRGRVIRQLLTESTLLGVLGGAAGVAAAVGTMAALVRNLPRQVPRADEIGVDLPVLAFALGVSLLAGVVFGMVPAFRSTRGGRGASLVEGSRNTTLGRARHRINKLLVVTEVALAMVLVIGAGLMLKSFAQLKRVDTGFESEGVVSFRPLPSPTRYPEAEHRRRYYGALLEQISAIPGVTSAATINVLPMSSTNSGVGYLVQGQEIPEGSVSQVVNYRAMSDDYFGTMRIPLLQGRLFNEGDHENAPEVGIVNEAMVRAHWPDEDPVGKRVNRANGDPWFTVVGVAPDIQHQLDLAPRPQVYQAVAQVGFRLPYVVVRTAGDPTNVLTGMRDAVRAVDQTVPILQLRTMDDVIQASLGDSRFFTSLFSTFAVLALMLGAVGVYGVMSYITSQSTREIGLRVALGAAPRDLIRTALGRGLFPVLLGVGVGIGVALAATRLLSNLLYEVATTDPLIFGGVAVILATIGGAASYLPARRASRVDPMVVLNDG